MGRDWERRRSPRISALDNAWNQSHQETIRIKRRKFCDASKLGKQVWKGRDNPQNEDHSTNFVEWRCGSESQKHDHHAVTCGKSSLMPVKHMLELVLDTLQRRDTYEIFAQPVDPDEVEDYYEIIKAPMDFGTMRAKLHEGMYTNLEQFEHDVFLIPENALHFNSSDTIYFRQARAIHELAKRGFDDLKRDPDNFVLKYSDTRRRSMRKEFIESKGTLHSQRSSKNNTAPKGISHHFWTGNRDGRLSSFQITNRRSTYWTWMSFLYNHNESVPLVQMVEGDIHINRYRESLMSFVKDLGPIAQMVAKRKLLGAQNKSGNVSAFRDTASGDHPLVKMSSNVIDLTKDGGGEETNGRNGIEEKKNEEKEKMGLTNKRGTSSRRRKRRRNNAMSPDDDDDDGDNMQPVILALENSHQYSSTFLEFKSRNKKKSCAPIAEEAMPLVVVSSQFTFDLPFLKARLNQMTLPISKIPLVAAANSDGGGGDEVLLLNCSDPITHFLEGNQSLDTTNLALGL